MSGDADIAMVAAALADARRCRMLLALADGRALPAGRLAVEAGVAPSTASAHLAKLVESGLICAEGSSRRDQRQRLFRLANGEVARALEAIARIAPPARTRTLRESSRAAAVRRARLCYDHLAGRLGVALMDALLAHGILADDDGSYRLTAEGVEVMNDLGVDVAPLRTRRRPLIRVCVDWSERRPHLAGALGAAVADRLFTLAWIERAPVGRAVRVTETGSDGLQSRFGVSLGGG